MVDLKNLEIQRLIRELQFLESDYAYQSEIIRIHSPLFLDSIEKVVSEFPDLRSISESRQDNNIMDQDVSYQDEEVIVDKIPDQKIKSAYRDIVKITHPDKVKNKKLNDLYLETIDSYESGDVVGIYKISLDLNIDFDWTENEISEILSSVNDLKGKIELIKMTYTYKWIKADNKNEVVLDYIKSNFLNNINSNSSTIQHRL